MRGSVSIRTYKFYKSVVRCHIKPGIGGVKMKALTPRRIQHLYARERDFGYSVTTRVHTHTTLKKMLTQATQWGDIQSNPAAFLKPPKARNEDSTERGDDFIPFSEVELKRLAEATKDNRMCAL